MTIHLTTIIQAPVERVFNLSRSIDLHTLSTHRTGEKAIAGRMKGLIELHEQVTWQARHLGKIRQHTSIITSMQPPYFFEDKMLHGDFKYFKHQHHFNEHNNDTTLMSDILDFRSPYGALGKLVDKVFMKKYLTRFLEERNETIRQYAEGEEWKKILV